MKILITCLSFRYNTGSELYFYELAKQLTKLGCKVAVLSQLKDGELWKKAEKEGIPCFDFSQAPNQKFDIILGSHRPVLEQLIAGKMYDGTPIISINHSEIINLEFPVLDSRIVKYIAIRESIKTFLLEKYFIDPDDVVLIYNPVNVNRFTPRKDRKKVERKTVIFPATIDYLRRGAIENLCQKAKEDDFDVIFIGKIQEGQDYLDVIRKENKNVRWFPPTNSIENFYAMGTHTAGIMLGRTSIEGFFYGLPAIIYVVDKAGNVQMMEEMTVPSDMSIFDSRVVAKQIKELCESIIK